MNKHNLSKTYPCKRGFSLVETLVAISILILAVIGPMRIASQSIRSAEFAREQLTAIFLAEEGVEAILAVRDTMALSWDGSWSNFVSLLSTCKNTTGCDLEYHTNYLNYTTVSSFVSGYAGNFKNCATISNCVLYFDESATNGRFYTHTNSGSLPDSIYTRVITVEEINAHEITVTSTVSWGSSYLQDTVSVESQTTLFDQYEQL